jgi:ubiquinone/menaquinone biosynthesis C-methylase UbiE
MNTVTNIGYWEKVLQDPSPAYQEFFEAESSYILDNIPMDSKVVDVGCGNGRNIEIILQKTKNITGIDTDERIVRETQDRFKDLGSVKILEGDASHIPLESNLFDVVTLLVVLMNLDQGKQSFFNEAARILKNGGILIVSTYSEYAFDERMRAYKKVEAPIVSIEGTKFIFDKSLGAYTSEQSSKEDLEKLGKGAGFEMVDCLTVGRLAYICKFKKI